jgi:hypothetical protein
MILDWSFSTIDLFLLIQYYEFTSVIALFLYICEELKFEEFRPEGLRFEGCFLRTLTNFIFEPFEETDDFYGVNNDFYGDNKDFPGDNNELIGGIIILLRGETIF